MSQTFISIDDFNDDLWQAVASIDLDWVTLVINKPIDVYPNEHLLIIPENITLMFVDTGKLNLLKVELSEEHHITAIVEVYSPSNVTAPSRMEIKSGEGTLRFTRGGEVELGWWGYRVKDLPEPPYVVFANGYLQEAIDSLKDASGCGIVNIPSALIKLRQTYPIHCRSNVSLRGKGYGTILAIENGTFPPEPPPATNTILHLEGVENIFIEHITFSSGSISESAQIEIRGGCKHLRIERCTFIGGWSSIWSTPGENQTNEYIDIFNNHFNTGAHQVYIGSSYTYSEQHRYIKIIGNRFKTLGDGGADAIKLRKRVQDVLIQNNIMQGTPSPNEGQTVLSGDGIDLFGSGDRVSIIGNVIEHYGVNGIDIKTDDQGYPPAERGKNRQVIIKGNILRNNDGAGIKVATSALYPMEQWAYLVEISDNQIYENKQHGIWCGGKYIGILGNHIYKNARNRTINNLAGIRLEGNYRPGVQLYSEHISVIGNTINSNGNGNQTNAGVHVTDYVRNYKLLNNQITSEIVEDEPGHFVKVQDFGIIITGLTENGLLKNNCSEGHIHKITEEPQNVWIDRQAKVMGESVSCQIGNIQASQTDELPLLSIPCRIYPVSAALINAQNIPGASISDAFTILHKKSGADEVLYSLSLTSSGIQAFTNTVMAQIPTPSTSYKKMQLEKNTVLSFGKSTQQQALDEARIIINYITY